MINSSKAFQRERPTWGNVIRLNVVKAMLLILDILNQLQAGADSEEEDSKRVELTPDLLMLKQRLAPLYQLEESFAALLSPGFRVRRDPALLHASSSTLTGREVTVKIAR